jgi:hypothetical protein
VFSRPLELQVAGRPLLDEFDRVDEPDQRSARRLAALAGQARRRPLAHGRIDR